MDGFVILIMFLLLRYFCINKRHVAPNRNLVNFARFNKVLRSEVYVGEGRQLRAVHLILDFEPLSDKFQDIGHAIRASNPSLA